MSKIIEVKDLSLRFNVKVNNQVKSFYALNNVSLDINQGEMIGIIGESGSGKSTLALSILNLIQKPGEITHGEVIYLGKDDILQMNEDQLRNIRWNEVSTVFQAAQNALNPIIKIYDHFLETWEAHNGKVTNIEEYEQHVRQLLSKVRLQFEILDKYSFELSGGQKQRVLIALSLLLEPKIIILDEPTTALDVINQWYILEILQSINEEMGVTLVFLTHDISIIGSMINKLVVMYAGEIVEIGHSKQIYDNPKHPYTIDLLGSVPSLDDDFSVKTYIKGETYDLMNSSDGCRYFNRCTRKTQVNCDGSRPNCEKLFEIDDNQKVLCIHGGRDE